MVNSMDLFTISSSDTFRNALKKIDLNQRGFLVVVDKNNCVRGTLTDGDIRRAFLRNNLIDSVISEDYNREFTWMSVTDNPYTAIEIFKSKKIGFIPILSEDGKLHNIMTKTALHTLLLENTRFDSNFDFQSVDDSLVDHEIYQRPWGFYKTTVINDMFQSKVINVDPKGQLSYQVHQKREEHWIIINGSGEVRLDDSFIDVKAGSSVFIPKGCRHRLKNTSDTEALILVEVQLGQYFGEDDIERIADDYGRS